MENVLSKIRAMADTGQPVADSPLRGDGIPGLDSPSLALSEIVDKFNKSLGLTVRQGRMSLKGARGQYDLSTGVIRQRVHNDITTLAHEGGHALESRYSALRALMEQHRAALRPLATPGEPLSEGFAEWFRRYVENPMSAVHTAPEFYSAFEQKMKELAPKELGELQEIQKAYQEWLAAPSAGVIAKDIVTTPKLGAAEKLKSDIQAEGFGTTFMKMSHKIYTAMVDDLHPIKMAVDNLTKIARQNLAPELGDGQSIGLKASDDVYKLARLARNAYGSGHMDIMEGVRGYRKTRHRGASLREALNMAVNVDGKWSEDAMNDFGAYLASRRMIGEWDRYFSGDLDAAPDKFSRADFQQAREDIETAYPQFVGAAEKVYEFNRQMLKKKYGIGALK